ncbi:MAG: class I tRNA ligase family protein [Bacteroidia bacterium]
MSKYKEYKKLDFPAFEEEVLKFWQEHKIFEKSVNNREGKESFVFYEGPPSANGMPGIHHVMARTVKDIFCRYQTLNGKQVKRKAGWDTHGLPIELQVEKNLGITKEDIGKKISVADYNEACRKDVLKFKDVWDKLTDRMGYWVDLSDPYITYDNNYIESLWWLLKQLYDKKLLYKGYTIQPYSPAAGTGLSSHELNQQGTYRDVKDSTAVAMFKVEDASKLGVNEDVYFLAWTTTPWTLPSNTALAVGEKITYVLVKTFNPYTFQPCSVVLAKDLFGKYFKTEHAELSLSEYKSGDKNIPFEVIKEINGKDLAGIRYEQLLPFAKVENGDAFKVIVGDFVTTEDGTGIVHIAPSFGADDFRVAKQNGIGALTLVDKRGKFLPEVKDDKFLYGEEFVKEAYLSDAEKAAELEVQKEMLKEVIKDTSKLTYLSVDERIILKLQLEGKLFKKEKYEHTYPHCWRTDKPILYYPLESWFIKTTAAKDRLVELNKTINWKPEHTGTGRFGNWLENLVDWNLSRSRYWGTPLPIWTKVDKVAGPILKPVNPTASSAICIGSVEELKDFGYYTGVKYKTFFDLILSDNKNAIQILRSYFITNGQNDEERFATLITQIKNSHKDNGLPVWWLFSFDYLKIDLLKEHLSVKVSDMDDFDLHKPYVDDIYLIKDGEIYRREPDLIDVWFDSGAMPYAQWHWPFENEETFRKNFPADYIAEGVDQTRGWFFTLHAISVLLFDSIAYKNVIANGLVLDKNGNKMSKRLGNVVDPFEAISKYGADANRWYMMSNSDPWDNLKFDIEGVAEVQRKFFGTLYNTYSFFALYANIDGFAYKEANIPHKDRPEIDRWVLSLLNTLVAEVRAHMDDYDPTPAARAISDFVNEHLSNWYVRLCRKRFWRGEYTEDKISAYQTLYTCLETVAQLMSPLAPFYADQLFRDLNAVSGRFKVESVHLTDLPVADTTIIDKELEEQMDYAQKISSLVLSIRKKENIRVRQPLQKILIPVVDARIKEEIEHVKDLILSEVNVKELEYIESIEKSVKANFKILGKKAGNKMKALAALITQFNQEQISQLENSGRLDLTVDGEVFTLSVEDVEILSSDIPGYKVANEGKITVALDVNITPELKSEGIAREVVNRLQNLRKDLGFEVTDRISVEIKSHDFLNDAINSHKSYICTQILAETLTISDSLSGGVSIEVEDITTDVKLFKN